MSEIALLGQPIPGRLTTIGYTPPSQMAFDEWEAVGVGLMRLHGGLKWWVGDWLNYGERAFGHSYSQALDRLGMAYQTLVNAASVAHRVPAEHRREQLSWSHHELVAKFDAGLQQAWLDRAEEEDWTVADLRAALRPREPRQAPVEVAPIEVAPVEVAPVAVAPIAVAPAVEPEVEPPKVEAEKFVEDIEALTIWSRRRIGLVWTGDTHRELMARVARLL